MDSFIELPKSLQHAAIIHFPPMPYGNDGNYQSVAIDLVDGSVIADADAPGVAAP